MLERRFLKYFDFTLLGVTLMIIAYGCVMIYSAEHGGSRAAGYVEKQVIWAIIGLVFSMIAAFIDHSVYHRQANRIYVLTVIVLLAVRFIGDARKGAQRWIELGPVVIQPSEFAKIAIIITLAVFLVRRRESLKSFNTFIWSLLHLGLPMGLIFIQPDLGTSMVLIAIWAAMIFVAGTDIKNILLFFGVGITLALIAWNVPGVMKDYQKMRVITFLNPAADPLGSGYHVTQSRIAIGSGQIWGKGFLKGTQRELRFIPEQHTDFIFTVVGEELGFVGATVLLLLYFLVVYRALVIMSVAEETTGRLIAAGITGMFFFQVIVNLGMTMGIMPVTGIPLPMFSYGGSSLLANLVAIGMLQGISMRRHRINF